MRKEFLPSKWISEREVAVSVVIRESKNGSHQRIGITRCIIRGSGRTAQQREVFIVTRKIQERRLERVDK